MPRAEAKARIFLANPSGTYVATLAIGASAIPASGWLATRGTVDAVPFCTTISATVTLDAASVKAPPLEFWAKIVRRVELPSDVETLLVQPIEMQRAHVMRLMVLIHPMQGESLQVSLGPFLGPLIVKVRRRKSEWFNPYARAIFFILGSCYLLSAICSWSPAPSSPVAYLHEA